MINKMEHEKTAHEKEHNCKVHAIEIRDENIKYSCFPITRGELELAIDVWDMQIRSLKVNDEFRAELADKIPMKLAETIIYDENNGAWNISGWYYPQTKESYDKLLLVVSGDEK